MMALELVKWKLSKKESIGPIIDDKQAKDVLAVWQIHPVYVKDFKVSEDAEPRTVLSDLWTHATFNMENLSATTMIPETRLKKIFARLRDLHLIWPDGTITEQSVKLLNADQAAYLNDRIPRWRPYEQPRNNQSRPSVVEQDPEGIPPRQTPASGTNKSRRRNHG